jgi:hypothetical protein
MARLPKQNSRYNEISTQRRNQNHLHKESMRPGIFPLVRGFLLPYNFFWLRAFEMYAHTVIDNGNTAGSALVRI